MDDIERVLIYDQSEKKISQLIFLIDQFVKLSNNKDFLNFDIMRVNRKQSQMKCLYFESTYNFHCLQFLKENNIGII